MFNRRQFCQGLAAAVPGLALAMGPARAADDIIVFAAASLRNAFDAAAAAWLAETSKQVRMSYAASPSLARQIEQGAPADLFISADRDWMNYLAERGLVRADSIVELLGNGLVLIAPKDATLSTSIEVGFPLARLLGDGRLAMAHVAAVPAGKYGKAALTSLGVWESVAGSIAQAENARAALKLVANGEAALGIVFKTDAMAEPAVRIIGTFPAQSHPPIIYPAAVVGGSSNRDAPSFLTFLQSAKAQTIFRDQGFTVLVPAATD